MSGTAQTAPKPQAADATAAKPKPKAATTAPETAESRSTLAIVNFGADSATAPLPFSAAALDSIVKTLNQYPNRRYELHAYSCPGAADAGTEPGSAAMRAAAERVKAMGVYLAEHGVPPGNISAVKAGGAQDGACARVVIVAVDVGVGAQSAAVAITAKADSAVTKPDSITTAKTDSAVTTVVTKPEPVTTAKADSVVTKPDSMVTKSVLVTTAKTDSVVTTRVPIASNRRREPPAPEPVIATAKADSVVAKPEPAATATSDSVSTEPEAVAAAEPDSIVIAPISVFNNRRRDPPPESVIAVKSDTVVTKPDSFAARPEPVATPKPVPFALKPDSAITPPEAAATNPEPAAPLPGSAQIAVYATGSGVPDNVKNALGARILASLVNSGRYGGFDRTTTLIAAIETARQAQGGAELDDRQICALGREFGTDFVCVVGITPVLGEFQVAARIVATETAKIAFIGEEYSPLNSVADLVRIADNVVKTMFGAQIERGSRPETTPASAPVSNPSTPAAPLIYDALQQQGDAALQQGVTTLGQAALRQGGAALGQAALKKGVGALGQTALKQGVGALGQTALKQGAGALGQAALKEGATALGETALQQGASALGQTALKQGVGAIGQTALKQGAGALGQTALKQGAGALGQTALKQGAGALGQTALKQGAGALGQTALKQGAEALGQTALQQGAGALGQAALKQGAGALGEAALKQGGDALGQAALKHGLGALKKDSRANGIVIKVLNLGGSGSSNFVAEHGIAYIRHVSPKTSLISETNYMWGTTSGGEIEGDIDGGFTGQKITLVLQHRFGDPGKTAFFIEGGYGMDWISYDYHGEERTYYYTGSYTSSYTREISIFNQGVFGGIGVVFYTREKQYPVYLDLPSICLGKEYISYKIIGLRFAIPF